jgi:large subunit ribosomal protein L16
MLAPKKTKFRKAFRGDWRRLAIKGHTLNMGKFGMVSTERGYITDRQIEAVRVVLSRETKKIGRYWLRIFPHKPYTKKPLEVGMGSGKGDVAYYVASVTIGTVLFELDGISFEEAKRIFKKAASKLPVMTKVLSKDE